MDSRKNENVKRLLRALENNIDDRNIIILAQILNYHVPQLRKDIDSIDLEVFNVKDQTY